MNLPGAAFGIIKEAARHVLRRPVVGVCAFAKARDGRILLVRRRDTLEWALPGGTLEWGETLESCIRRELLEESSRPITRWKSRTLDSSSASIYQKPCRTRWATW